MALTKAQQAAERQRLLEEAILIGTKPEGSQPEYQELGPDRVKQYAYRFAVLREYPGIPSSTHHSHLPNIEWYNGRRQTGNSANIQCWRSGRVMFTGCKAVPLSAITDDDWELAKEVVAVLEQQEAAKAAAVGS